MPRNGQRDACGRVYPHAKWGQDCGERQGRARSGGAAPAPAPSGGSNRPPDACGRPWGSDNYGADCGPRRSGGGGGGRSGGDGSDINKAWNDWDTYGRHHFPSLESFMQAFNNDHGTNFSAASVKAHGQAVAPGRTGSGGNTGGRREGGGGGDGGGGGGLDDDDFDFGGGGGESDADRIEREREEAQERADRAREEAERRRIEAERAAEKLRTQKDAFATIQSLLADYGLESMGGWLWDQILQDKPEAQIFLEIRNRPEYQRRFPGMKLRQQKGLRTLSESEYIMAEESYRQTLRKWGANPSKFDDPSDFVNYFVGDISADEVNARGEIWFQISKAPNTTARLKGLIRQYTGTANVSDEDLFKALVEADSQILSRLNIGLSGAGVNNASLETLKSYIAKAYMTEAATFAGGGGKIKQQGGFQTGLVGAKTEKFT